MINICSRIKNDDMLIQAEGVESLSEAELREDCRERGMLGLLSVEEMRQQVYMTDHCRISFVFQCVDIDVNNDLSASHYPPILEGIRMLEKCSGLR